MKDEAGTAVVVSVGIAAVLACFVVVNSARRRYATPPAPPARRYLDYEPEAHEYDPAEEFDRGEFPL